MASERAGTNASRIAAALRREIADGKLKPGQQLYQQGLSERFGVSRIPVREALRQLEAEGLVSYHPNRGALVVWLSERDVQEIYQIREILETAAITLAISRITPDTIERAARVLADLDAQTSYLQWSRIHWEFHRTLYEPCGNERLLQLIHSHYIKAESVKSGRDVVRAAMSSAHSFHEELLSACRRLDAGAASSVTHRHIDHMRRLFLQAARSQLDKP